MRSALATLAPLTRLRPGWYLLAALLVYALVVTVQWRAAAVELRDVRMTEADAGAADPAGPERGTAERATADPATADPATADPATADPATADPAAADPAAADPAAAPATPARAAAVDSGLWFPVPGARIPSDDDHLPGAARAYRSGLAEGFSFWPESSGVPIVHGTPVIAAGSGEAIRVDAGYVEPSAAEWEALLARVEAGADDADLDLLRGRQVWLRLDDGRVVRYGHLASVRSGLSVGQRVAQGRVIGTVGNSGTPDGIAGRAGNARLHFEVRDDDTYFGAGLPPDEVRLAATSLFTGP